MKRAFFDNDKVLAIFTNRKDGVSKGAFASLNIAFHVGDDEKLVKENRKILANKLDFDLNNLIYMNQVHKTNIKIIRENSLNEIKNCDGIITNLIKTPLLVMVADCIPILLYDKKKHIIGAIHAGRNGTFMGIVKKSIFKMQSEFNSNPKDILVSLGSSINSCCYEIAEDLANITIKNFGERYIIKKDLKYYLDLQTLNLNQLLDMGVQMENIEISDECSCCNNNYFSYRRDGISGRFGGVIMLKK